MRRSTAAALALFLCLSLANCSKKQEAAMDEKSVRETFRDLIHKYEMAMLRKEARPNRDAPFVRGRVLVVRSPMHGDGDYIAGDLFADAAVMQLLPKELIATKPDEVGTIAHVHCKDELIGSYTDGTRAYAWKCEMAVVDPATFQQSVVGRWRGPDPPHVVNAGGIKYLYGDRPLAEMAKALADLPRK